MANVAPNAPGVIRCTLDQHFGGAVNIMNRLFYTFVGTMDQGVATAVATQIAGSWNTEFATLLTSHYTLDTVTVTDLSTDTGTQVVHPAGFSGTLASTEYLPAQTSMCLTAQIARRYRGGKPRWYQSGMVPANLQDNQTWTATAVGQWEAAFSAFAKALEAYTITGGQINKNVNLSLVDGYTWTEYTTSSGKVNYRKDPIYRAQAVTDVVIDWTVNPRVSNQRKRGVN